MGIKSVVLAIPVAAILHCSAIGYGDELVFKKYPAFQDARGKYHECQYISWGKPSGIYLQKNKNEKLVLGISGGSGRALAMGIILPIFPAFFLKETTKESIGIHYLYLKTTNTQFRQLVSSISIDDGQNPVEFQIKVDKNPEGNGCKARKQSEDLKRKYINIRLKKPVPRKKDLFLNVWGHRIQFGFGARFYYAPNVM